MYYIMGARQLMIVPGTTHRTHNNICPPSRAANRPSARTRPPPHTVVVVFLRARARVFAPSLPPRPNTTDGVFIIIIIIIICVRVCNGTRVARCHLQRRNYKSTSPGCTTKRSTRNINDLLVGFQGSGHRRIAGPNALKAC